MGNSHAGFYRVGSEAQVSNSAPRRNNAQLPARTNCDDLFRQYSLPTLTTNRMDSQDLSNPCSNFQNKLRKDVMENACIAEDLDPNMNRKENRPCSKDFGYKYGQTMAPPLWFQGNVAYGPFQRVRMGLPTSNCMDLIHNNGNSSQFNSSNPFLNSRVNDGYGSSPNIAAGTNPFLHYNPFTDLNPNYYHQKVNALSGSPNTNQNIVRDNIRVQRSPFDMQNNSSIGGPNQAFETGPEIEQLVYVDSLRESAGPLEQPKNSSTTLTGSDRSKHFPSGPSERIVRREKYLKEPAGSSGPLDDSPNGLSIEYSEFSDSLKDSAAPLNQPKDYMTGPTGTSKPKDSTIGPTGTSKPKDSTIGPTGSNQPKDNMTGPTGLSQPKDYTAGPIGSTQPQDSPSGPSGQLVQRIAFSKEPTGSSWLLEDSPKGLPDPSTSNQPNNSLKEPSGTLGKPQNSVTGLNVSVQLQGSQNPSYQRPVPGNKPNQVFETGPEIGKLVPVNSLREPAGSAAPLTDSPKEHSTAYGKSTDSLKVPPGPLSQPKNSATGPTVSGQPQDLLSSPSGQLVQRRKNISKGPSILSEWLEEYPKGLSGPSTSNQPTDSLKEPSRQLDQPKKSAIGLPGSGQLQGSQNVPQRPVPGNKSNQASETGPEIQKLVPVDFLRKPVVTFEQPKNYSITLTGSDQPQDSPSAASERLVRRKKSRKGPTGSSGQLEDAPIGLSNAYGESTDSLKVPPGPLSQPKDFTTGPTLPGQPQDSPSGPSGQLVQRRKFTKEPNASSWRLEESPKGFSAPSTSNEPSNSLKEPSKLLDQPKNSTIGSNGSSQLQGYQNAPFQQPVPRNKPNQASETGPEIEKIVPAGSLRESAGPLEQPVNPSVSPTGSDQPRESPSALSETPVLRKGPLNSLREPAGSSGPMDGSLNIYPAVHGEFNETLKKSFEPLSHPKDYTSIPTGSNQPKDYTREPTGSNQPKYYMTGPTGSSQPQDSPNGPSGQLVQRSKFSKGPSGSPGRLENSPEGLSAPNTSSKPSDSLKEPSGQLGPPKNSTIEPPGSGQLKGSQNAPSQPLVPRNKALKKPSRSSGQLKNSSKEPTGSGQLQDSSNGPSGTSVRRTKSSRDSGSSRHLNNSLKERSGKSDRPKGDAFNEIGNPISVKESRGSKLKIPNNKGMPSKNIPNRNVPNSSRERQSAKSRPREGIKSQGLNSRNQPPPIERNTGDNVPENRNRGNSKDGKGSSSSHLSPQAFPVPKRNTTPNKPLLTNQIRKKNGNESRVALDKPIQKENQLHRDKTIRELITYKNQGNNESRRGESRSQYVKPGESGGPGRGNHQKWTGGAGKSRPASTDSCTIKKNGNRDPKYNKDVIFPVGRPLASFRRLLKGEVETRLGYPIDEECDRNSTPPPEKDSRHCGYYTHFVAPRPKKEPPNFLEVTSRKCTPPQLSQSCPNSAGKDRLPNLNYPNQRNFNTIPFPNRFIPKTIYDCDLDSSRSTIGQRKVKVIKRTCVSLSQNETSPTKASGLTRRFNRLVIQPTCQSDTQLPDIYSEEWRQIQCKTGERYLKELRKNRQRPQTYDGYSKLEDLNDFEDKYSIYEQEPTRKNTTGIARPQPSKSSLKKESFKGGSKKKVRCVQFSAGVPYNGESDDSCSSSTKRNRNRSNRTRNPDLDMGIDYQKSDNLTSYKPDFTVNIPCRVPDAFYLLKSEFDSYLERFAEAIRATHEAELARLSYRPPTISARPYSSDTAANRRDASCEPMHSNDTCGPSANQMGYSSGSSCSNYVSTSCENRSNTPEPNSCNNPCNNPYKVYSADQLNSNAFETGTGTGRLDNVRDYLDSKEKEFETVDVDRLEKSGIFAIARPTTRNRFVYSPRSSMSAIPTILEDTDANPNSTNNLSSESIWGLPNISFQDILAQIDPSYPGFLAPPDYIPIDYSLNPNPIRSQEPEEQTDEFFGNEYIGNQDEGSKYWSELEYEADTEDILNDPPVGTVEYRIAQESFSKTRNLQISECIQVNITDYGICSLDHILEDENNEYVPGMDEEMNELLDECAEIMSRDYNPLYSDSGQREGLSENQNNFVLDAVQSWVKNNSGNDPESHYDINEEQSANVIPEPDSDTPETAKALPEIVRSDSEYSEINPRFIIKFNEELPRLVSVLRKPTTDDDSDSSTGLPRARSKDKNVRFSEVLQTKVFVEDDYVENLETSSESEFNGMDPPFGIKLTDAIEDPTTPQADRRRSIINFNNTGSEYYAAFRNPQSLCSSSNTTKISEHTMLRLSSSDPTVNTETNTRVSIWSATLNKNQSLDSILGKLNVEKKFEEKLEKLLQGFSCLPPVNEEQDLFLPDLTNNDQPNPL